MPAVSNTDGNRRGTIRRLTLTVAVCVKCGSIKYGAFNPCQACGVRPKTETDIAYSLALTDHYFKVDVLHEISADMRSGASRPSLPKEQEDRFREAARAHIEQFGWMIDLPLPTDPSALRRMAKFADGNKCRLNSTAPQSLYQHAGFGWMSVVLLIAMIVVAVISSGFLRVVSLAAASLVLVFTIHRWRRWNKHGWPQVHHRAMLIYAAIAGLEAGEAKRENRQFSKVAACRALAHALVGEGQQPSVDAMITGLAQERGNYFADLVQKFGARAAPKLDAKTLHIVSEQLRELDFCPQSVIGNIVENTFGGEEAARYVIALLTKKAQ